MSISCLAIRPQRGAATVMLVLFLLAVVAFALTLALNMAGSDITDSAMHNDATEALFLAESGIERAAKRFADGTSCTTTALAESVPFGRGKFTVLEAVFTANICRARVQGEVRATKRVVLGDATTLLYEPLPDKYSVPAVLDAAWPETIIKKDGKSGYDIASAVADATGSLIMQTKRGRKNKFEAYRRRTLPAAITGPQVVTLNLAYKMNYTGAPPSDQQLQVRLVDSAGVARPVPGADFNGPSNANVWIVSPTLTDTIPAGVTITRIELYYKLANGNSKDAQTFLWADNVRLTTSAAAFPLKAWTEIIQ